MKGLSLLSVLVFASAITAAPPKIEIPADNVPVGGYVRIAPKTDAVSVVYVALDGAHPFPSEELKDAKRFLLPVAGLNPGKYRYTAVAASKTGEQAVTEFTVTIPGKVEPGPDPQPGPQPQPGPKPNPVPPGKRFVVIIEETEQAVPARGIMMSDAALAARMKEKGHQWRIADQNNRTATGSVPVDLKPYLEEAAGKKLPRLYIVAPDGTVCWYGDAPTGSDVGVKTLELLKAAGG